MPLVSEVAVRKEEIASIGIRINEVNESRFGEGDVDSVS